LRCSLHKHHKVPKHAGGSDDPSNIEFLTVPEHAEAHKKFWEEYGNEYDRIAWLALSGLIGKDEAFLETCRATGRLNGLKCYERNTGIFSLTEEEKYAVRSKAGKIGGKRVGELGVTGFQTGAAGKIGGKRTQELGYGVQKYTLEQQSEYGRKGGVVAGKMPFWINVKTGKLKRSYVFPGEDWKRGRKL
jgi:hypothetical protein